MSHATRSVSGTVKVLACKSCDSKFPIFEYDVESDAAVIGLASAGVCGAGLVVLFELGLEDWRLAQAGQLELPAEFVPDGEELRMTSILRIEAPPLPPASTSFSVFRERYRAPYVIYRCPCCEGGEAVSVDEITALEFVSKGGRIISVSPICPVE